MKDTVHVPVVVVGAGHSGLAASYWLREKNIAHVLLERGVVGESWHAERWDSLRLLTPNWQNGLPGFPYKGVHPDGFMDVREFVDFVRDYAKFIQAPVCEHTEVIQIRKSNDSYLTETTKGKFQSQAVILASGACKLANVPTFSDGVPEDVFQVHSLEYKNPNQLPEGRVLVVGASATGLQLSDEIHLTGRPVTLSVGEHVRMPRTYRNRDIQWWMNVTGLLDDTIDAVDDLVRARNIPSPQLIGTTDLSTIDLNCLMDRGVELVGRIAAIQERNGTTIAQFSGSLGNVCRLADLKLNRLLKSFDEWADLQPKLEVGDPQVFESTAVPEKPELDKNLGGKEGIKSVVWATGYKPDFQFLKLPVFDRKQRLNHEGGVVSGASGMYVLGLTFLRRRKSSFIHGAEEDARELVEHLESFIRDSRLITDSTC